MPRRHVLLATRLGRLEQELPALALASPDAVHDARVATRRLRELLPLLPLTGKARESLSRRLRRATQRLGRVLRPKADGRQAHFYTVVSRDTIDTEYAAHRQRFLAEQGYAYTIVDADDVLGPPLPRID